MLFRLIAFGLFFFASTVAAQTPYLRESTIPYEVVVIDDNPEAAKTIMSTLAGFPDMYEVVSDSEFTLSLQLKQPVTAGTPTTHFSLIVVEENERARGVTEVLRQNPNTTTDWTKVSDAVLALPLLVAEPIAIPLSAGIYRFEVSTPNNTGSYLLELGSDTTGLGYRDALARVRAVHDFVGVSSWRIVRSSLVFYPILAVVFVGLLGLSWRYRDRLRYGLR